jgi:hypothetical protein
LRERYLLNFSQIGKIPENCDIVNRKLGEFVENKKTDQVEIENTPG